MGSMCLPAATPNLEFSYIFLFIVGKRISQMKMQLLLQSVISLWIWLMLLYNEDVCWWPTITTQLWSLLSTCLNNMVGQSLVLLCLQTRWHKLTKTFHSWSCHRVPRMKLNMDITARLCWSAWHDATKNITSTLPLGMSKSRCVSWAWIRLVQVMEQWYTGGEGEKVQVLKLLCLKHSRTM